MKKLLLLHLLLMLSLALSAQNWHTDFATAKSIAEKENKSIVLVFSGSDWCAPCMKLEKEIWSSGIFKTYAQAHYVLLKADFPKRKQNVLHIPLIPDSRTGLFRTLFSKKIAV